ncbi:MAG: hypothetical protein IH865_09375 [Chloroflexi bacterium]|nr:hypothetical protein [Chloroflexota bacterium]
MRSLVALVGMTMVLAFALPEATEAAPLVEVKKLLASDAQASGQFGYSVAISGDTAVVGSFDEGSGAAYVFQRAQGGADDWGEVKKLTAFNAEAGDDFGISVAVSGDTAVVGASGEDARGIGAGAAYVFQRNRGGADDWGEVKKLVASDAQAFDEFGISVAVSGDTAVVGAVGEDAGGIGAGAAYVFRRNEGGAGNWGQVKKLTASSAQASDEFGISVAVSGDSAVVGARGEDAGGSNAGAAYVFERARGGASNWGRVKKLVASDAQAFDEFGVSVAVAGDIAVVGAWLEDGGGTLSGAAYVFQRSEGGVTNWGEVKKLTTSDTPAFNEFGISVAVSGDTAVVGAYLADAGGTFGGAAYVFQRDEGGADDWGEVSKLSATDIQNFDRFGFSVAVSSQTAVVGAFGEDARGSEAGAAYVFELLGANSTPTGTLSDTPTPAGTLSDTPTPTATDTPVPSSTPIAPATPDVSTGDVNCDNTVNAVDAALILFKVALIGSLPCPEHADVNGDGVTSSLDAVLVLQFVAGLIDSL